MSGLNMKNVKHDLWWSVDRSDSDDDDKDDDDIDVDIGVGVDLNYSTGLTSR